MGSGEYWALARALFESWHLRGAIEHDELLNSTYQLSLRHLDHVGESYMYKTEREVRF